MPQLRRPGAAEVRDAVVDNAVLAASCLVAYWLTTHVLSHVYLVSKDDGVLGGLWAVISTIFVFRDSYQRSIAAAVSRMSATLLSFLVCLVYLSFLPFHVWALALLIGISGLAARLIGRPEDAATAAITTAVVMVVGSLSPRNAWQQPILRFADTLVGVAVGVVAAWLALRLIHRRQPG